MGWKEWPRWFKWGIISVIALGTLAILSLSVSVLRSFFYFESHGDYVTSGNGAIIGLILILMYILFSSIFLGSIALAGQTRPSLFVIIISVILSLIYYFAIGVLISWIYGKIKGDKK